MAAPLRAGVAGVALAALGLPLSACAGSQDAAVTDTARAFHSAIADADGAAACDLLTPATRDELEQSSGRRCPAAILEELEGTAPEAGGDPEVYGVMAQVRWPGATVFLTRMRGGWRVLAAGCVRRQDARYDCVVKGA